MSRARLIALPSLLLALVLAGCGSGASGGAGADPASAVPAGTAIYFQGVVRPEGSQRDDVLDAARKVLRTDDPERKLHDLIDKGLKDSKSGNVSYDKDIAPWLGKNAGVWVAGVNRAKPGYVVLVAAKDTDKAQEAIDKGAKAGGKVKQRSYSGVDYQVDSDGVAAGIVGDFFTVGTEPEFKRTIKAKDGASLAEDKTYARTIGALDKDRIGHFYIDLKPFFEQALKSDPQAKGQLEQFRSVFPIDKLQPVAGALLANGDRIAVDTITRGKGLNALKALGPLTGTGATPLLGELPGDSWGAIGAPRVGQSLKTLFDRVAGAFGGAAAAAQLKQRYGLDLDRDFFGWVGDIALFVRGTDKASIDGGLVIQATNPKNMQSAFGKIVGLIQSEGRQKVQPIKVKGAVVAFRSTQTDAGKPVVIARSADRVVAALGPAAAAAGLAPAQKLADSDLFTQGKALLGNDLAPSFLLSMPDLLSAVEHLGKPDADYAKAKPYLDALSLIVSGGSFKSDEVRSRVAVGLK